MLLAALTTFSLLVGGNEESYRRIGLRHRTISTLAGPRSQAARATIARAAQQPASEWTFWPSRPDVE